MTALYVAVLAVILLISSSVLYSAFSSRLERRFRPITPIQLRTEFDVSVFDPSVLPHFEDVRADFINSLIAVNGFLLILAGFLSYGLARLTLQPLQEAFEQQKRFLSDASHELRTPLSILKTDLENELRNQKNEQSQMRLQSNLEEVDRMSGLVNDLLALSRLDESSGSYIEKTDFDIQELLEQIVERLESLSKTHRVTIVLHTDSEIICVYSNRKLVDQIITNIVKNAIIYNKDQGSVNIHLEKSKRLVKVAISDTGMGISKEDLRKIFNRFYRTDTSRSRQTGGSGLGLSIVHAALQQIGGRITVKSELHVGTTFTIEFPHTS